MPVTTRSKSKVQAQYPCVSCGISVGEEQDSICCDTCNKWIHFECTNLSRQDFDFHCQNDDEPFHCVFCRPSTSSNNITHPTLPLVNVASEPASINPIAQPEFDSSTNSSNQSFNSNDFEYVTDDSDDDSRGLNFYALPTDKAHTSQQKSPIYDRPITIHVRRYKYPCLVCGSPCCEGQNSICCVLCDEWVHQKCTDLSLEQFYEYTCPENINDPYYCVNCLFGNSVDHELESPDQTSHTVLTSLIDSSDIPKYCPNSIFRNKDDISLGFFTY